MAFDICGNRRGISLCVLYLCDSNIILLFVPPYFLFGVFLVASVLGELRATRRDGNKWVAMCQQRFLILKE